MDTKTIRDAVQFVLDHPNVTASEIAEEFGISWSDAIQILVEADFVLDLTPDED